MEAKVSLEWGFQAGFHGSQGCFRIEFLIREFHESQGFSEWCLTTRPQWKPRFLQSGFSKPGFHGSQGSSRIRYLKVPWKPGFHQSRGYKPSFHVSQGSCAVGFLNQGSKVLRPTMNQEMDVTVSLKIPFSLAFILGHGLLFQDNWGRPKAVLEPKRKGGSNINQNNQKGRGPS